MRGLLESGSVMTLASRDVVTIPQTTNIKSSVELMVENSFRRLPVTDPGSGRLLGIIGSSDIVDLLGGGKKHQFIHNVHKGNFLSAINDSVRQVMNQHVLTIDEQGSGKEALELILSSKRGGLVIVDKEQGVKGILTERDFLDTALEYGGSKKVVDLMTADVISTTPGTTLGDAAKIMVRNSFRRLPVVSEGELVGMVTTRTMINFIGKNGVFNKLIKNDINEVMKLRIKDFMAHSTAAVQKDVDLETAIDLMISTNQGTVSVMDEEKLKGILTERDVIKSISIQ